MSCPINIERKNVQNALCVVYLVVVLAVAMLVVGVPNYASIHVEAKNPLSDLAKIQTELKLTVYGPEGNVKGVSVVADDLILNNYLKFMQAIFTEHSGSYVFAYLDCINNFSNQISVKHSATGGVANAFSNTDFGELGGFIQIGNGTTTEARSNYKLEYPQEGLVAVSAPSYSSGNISFSASISMTANRDVTEAGFFLKLLNGSSTPIYFLMFHDVFVAVPTSSGDSITVQYTVQLVNTGFTDNFGKMLAAIFTHVNTDGDFPALFLVEIGGSSRNATLYTDVSSASWLFDYGTGTPGCGIRVGTSDSALSRGSYELGNAVESLVSNSVASISASNVTTSASVVMSADRTIREAGYYIKFIDTGATIRTMLLWRALTGNVSVTIGNTITVTFTLVH